MIEIIGGAVALTLALAIGANNAGIAMGPAYGAGARGKWAALAIEALFYLVGSLTLGQRVVTAIGRDLFTVPLSTNPWIFLLVAPTAALTILTIANLVRVPISTTHAAVMSLVGVGLYLDVVRVTAVATVVAWWIVTPLAALVLGFLAAKFLRVRAPAWLLTVVGAYVAFAIGANNAANSMAPLVGGRLLGPFAATLLAGGAMALGALLWGGRTLQTVGKEILELSNERAVAVSVVSGTITIGASAFGVPISLTLVIATAMIGYSLGAIGVRRTAGNASIRRILAAWTASPLLAFAMTYGLMSVL